jgi:hypothetical protein
MTVVSMNELLYTMSTLQIIKSRQFNPICAARLDVLVAVTMKTAVVRNMMPHSLVEVYGNFRRPCHLCH